MLPSPSGMLASLPTKRAKAWRVIALDLRQPRLLGLIVAVMRQRVERIRHADMVVGLVAHFGRDHEALDAGQIALVGQRHEVEHQVQVFVEILGRCARHLRQLQFGDIALLCIAGAPLDLVHALQIVAQRRAILRVPGCGSSELVSAAIMSRILVVCWFRKRRSSGESP